MPVRTEVASLRRDVDTDADLEVAIGLGVGDRTRATLADLGEHDALGA